MIWLLSAAHGEVAQMARGGGVIMGTGERGWGLEDTVISLYLGTNGNI